MSAIPGVLGRETLKVPSGDPHGGPRARWVGAYWTNKTRMVEPANPKTRKPAWWNPRTRKPANPANPANPQHRARWAPRVPSGRWGGAKKPARKSF